MTAGPPHPCGLGGPWYTGAPGGGGLVAVDRMDRQQTPEDGAFLLMGEWQEVEDHLVMMATFECPV